MTGSESRAEDAETWDGSEGEPEWPVAGVETEYETPWFDAGYDAVERPDGAADYYWVDADDAVSVVAHDADADEVILVEEYRPRFRRRFRTCPGGAIEGDEDPLAAARRELREETGFEAGRVERLGTYYPSVWTRCLQHAVYATDLTPGDPDPDEGEEITVHRVPAGEAVRETLADRSVGWTVAPLLWAREADLL